jgi:hypothetical protein
MAYASGASGIEFRYEIVRMWEQSAERFLKAGVHLLPLATLCQLPPEKPASEAITQVVREIDRRLVEECDHAQGVRLMTAAFVLAGLRVKRDELSSVFHGVSIMHQESTAFDYYAEQGAIKLARRLLNRQGQKRFGKPDDKSLAALEEIEDLDRLERLSDAILTVASWEELLATP